MRKSFEQGPIRPPNEAYSLLIRVTRNCPWNKCLFCPVYKGEKFSKRDLLEVETDIYAMKEGEKIIKELALKKTGKEVVTREVVDEVYRLYPEYIQIALWLYDGGKNVFLQDADNLVLPTSELSRILSTIKETFPGVERITTYSRAKTAAKKTLEELKEISEAGLTRVHIGLETGHDPLLKLIKKGVSSSEQVDGGQKIKDAGLFLSEYIILGLGGKEMSKEHAIDTADVLTRINPHFIRVRTLGIREGIPLLEKVKEGELTLMDDLEILREKKLLVENLDVGSYFYSDHILNLLEEANGKLPEKKKEILGKIEEFLNMRESEVNNFCAGRRTGIYRYLDDLKDKERFARVEMLKNDLQERGIEGKELVKEVGGRFI